MLTTPLAHLDAAGAQFTGFTGTQGSTLTLRAASQAYFGSEVLFTKIKGDNVLQIQFSKPPGVQYHSGQYVFLKVLSLIAFLAQKYKC